MFMLGLSEDLQDLLLIDGSKHTFNHIWATTEAELNSNNFQNLWQAAELQDQPTLVRIQVQLLLISG